MSQYRYSLTSGQEKTFDCSGTFLYVKEATGALEITVQMESGKNDVLNLVQLDQIRTPDRIKMVSIKDASRAANSVEIAVGDVEFIPNTGNQVLNVAVQKPNGYTPDVETIGGTVTVLTAPAGAVEVTLQASDGNSGDIYIAAATGEGHKLVAGGAIGLDTSAAATISVIASAAGQTLYILWGTRT
ncbi:MAG: hypothetical protein RLZZ182_1839 [Pseudomonadota bacterium]|jgi:hypothetical protein